MFVNRCLSFCPFSFGHCFVCPSIYGFWLPIWYLQTLFLYFGTNKKKKITSQHNILIELILTYELSIGKLSLNPLREGLSFLFNNGLRCVNMISTKLYILIIYNPYTIAMLLFSNYRNNSYDNNWIRRWIYFEY
jgi:hypothetical protein